jgi:hypothetical protein
MRSAVLVLLLAALASAAPPYREISRAQLRDKIAGGWAGQMIGVSFGAPTEFRARGVINEGELPPWKPERVSNSLRQDDLYVDMTFAKVLDDKGLDATSDDFGAMFRDAKYALWHANLAARRNLRRGIPATLSGTPKYNAHANDIDFQIEADFIGLMAPGLPQWTNDMSLRAGRIMNYGDGIYGGMFVSCMYSAAFFEKDVRKVVEAGVACIPAKSPYAVMMFSPLEGFPWKMQCKPPSSTASAVFSCARCLRPSLVMARSSWTSAPVASAAAICTSLRRGGSSRSSSPVTRSPASSIRSGRACATGSRATASVSSPSCTAAAARTA